MNSIKNVTAQTLTADNYPIWRSQVQKLFRANGFEGFLTCTIVSPPPTILATSGQQIPNPEYHTWASIDQNLATALYSVISPSILPYVLSIDHCHEIWHTLDVRLQSSTRSRIAHLKDELHFLSMKDKNMMQYLLDVKSKVDVLAAAGAPVDIEDVIHYTLNGLPNTYQAFKIAIRTNMRSVSLDELYTLLCSEELNLAHETIKDLQALNLAGNQTALTAGRDRGRGRASQNRGRPNIRSQNTSNPSRGSKPNRPSITCQICGKFGHSAIKCWYRHDETYNSEPTPALFTTPTQPSSSEWFLDSGASSHLTSDPNTLQ
ncbi:Retrovirus-related Pol polyprotein from transposon TNT 1-94 [Dendrobium catenatum]|uniref:Retrovirus-related Pol polyprotein from transposon TNT 1-94 n=1 Tax=Dendrobium catenatum TaxID=906689 RepID=A0A2I0WR45_9ASPA|nr:Retrovirus-related Pol polyprotein from transposon TNT 1-94 [Dendrobium catenatum]